MTDFLQLLAAGISIGSIYAMTAIGFVLLWQTSNTINFAQGEFVVLPAFAMVLFWMVLRLPFAVALLATVLVSTFLLGLRRPEAPGGPAAPGRASCRWSSPPSASAC